MILFLSFETKIFLAMKLNDILENPSQPDSIQFLSALDSLGFLSFSSMEIQHYQITLQPVNTKSAVGVSRASGAQKDMCR